MSQYPVGVTPDGFPVLADAARQPGERPPCSACPKWEGVPGDPAPLTGDGDLFGSAWLADLWQHYREGRAVGDLGGADPFTRAALALLDAAERRLDRQRLIDGLLTAARLISRR